jgi:hypothetical protein
VAARLGRGARRRGRGPGRPGHGSAEELRARAAAVPLRLAAHGPHARLHHRRRRHALPAAAGSERPAPDGLGRVRAARRERRDPRRRPPARDDRAQHRQHPRLDEARRLVVRLAARALDARHRLLPLAAVAVPPLPGAGARLPQGRAREMVPERPDRGRERAGAAGRHVRALRRRRRVARHGAVVLPHHRLRAGAARRPGRGRLARVDQGAPAQLDRTLRGRGDRLPDRGVGRGRHRLHHASRHALRRNVLRPRAGAPARRADRLGGGARLRAPCRREEDGGARGGRGEDGRRYRPARGQPGQRRPDPGLGRRLRPDRLRHRRDHGRARARRARLRVRAGLRAAGASGRAAAG